MGGVPWSRKTPERYLIKRYDYDRGVEVWMIKEDDVWSVHCMDCGIKLGVVNAGYEQGAEMLHTRHQRDMHG